MVTWNTHNLTLAVGLNVVLMGISFVVSVFSVMDIV